MTDAARCDEYETVDGEWEETPPDPPRGLPALYQQFAPAASQGRDTKGRFAGGDAEGERRQAVEIMMVRGAKPPEIYEALVTYDIINTNTGLPWSKETIKRDMAEVRRAWKQHAKLGALEHGARVLAELSEVKRVSWMRGDMANVLGSIDREAKILGLYAAEHVNVVVQERARELAEAAGIGVDDLLAVARKMAKEDSDG